MVTFFCAHKNYRTWCKKRKIAFTEGRFATQDEEFIQHLRKHPLYGSAIVENGQIAKKTNIITDLRSAGVDELKAKFREYEELKQKCLRIDGSPKKDAIESDLNRINELKKELEL